MRLTLRTLLAYLDDVLDASQTREIGQKIRESPRAAALVSRIREVIRKRRLGAPDLDGPGQGLDPNLVAAYLDNSLAPDQVVEVERICLEADMQLAEVAACHQILTLVMSESREVSQASLDRYYALGPVPFEERLQIDEPEGARRPAAASAAAPADATAEFVARLPDYLKPSPWSQRVAPWAGVALIVILAVVLLAPDRELFRGLVKRDQQNHFLAQHEPAVPGEAVAPPARPPLPQREVNDATVESPTSSPAEALAAAPASNLPRGIDPAPPPDLPEPADSKPTAPALPAGTATAPATASAPAIPQPAVAVPESLVPAKPAVSKVPIQYTSVEGVLLRFEPGDGHWYVHPRRSEVHALEVFASPEPFEAQFDVARGALKLTLLGDSAMEVLPGTEASPMGIAVRRGRVVLQVGAKTQQDLLEFIVRAGQHTWTLRFSGPEAVCGVEVLLRDPPGFEKYWDRDGQHVALHVGAGSVLVHPATDPPLTVTAGQRRVLTSAAWPAESNGDLAATWLNPARRDRSEILKRFAARFEKEFDPTVAADLSIPALCKDPHPKMTELAARCLRLTDQYAALVQALAESEHEEARAVATNGLREWLGQAAGRGDLLRQELARYFVEDDNQTVYRLLWGLTPDDAKDKITSLQIVELLRSPRVQIRELAFQQLVQLTGRKYDYRPSDGISQRERAVQRWLAHIQREGGTLIKVE